MDLKQEFNFSSDKELNGVWREIDSQGTKILVARAGNRKFEAFLEKIMMEHRSRLRVLRGEGIDPVVREELTNRAIAETILLGWEGLTENGVTLEYSKAEAKRLLETYRDFKNIVVEESMRHDAFRLEEQKEAEKNS